MYEFTNDCLLNIDTIDDEHRHLFKLINDAFALIAETDDVTPVAKNLVSSLKDYANTHFAHEEAYMESINDPELALQKKEHAAFAAKIDGFKLDDSSSKAAKRSLNELLTYLVHFHDEEELMERIKYPGLEAQMKAHSAFVERLVGINLSELDDMDDNQQEYLLDLIQFLLSWLSNHILGADKKIGEFMREHNISE